MRIRAYRNHPVIPPGCHPSAGGEFGYAGKFPSCGGVPEGRGGFIRGKFALADAGEAGFFDFVLDGVGFLEVPGDDDEAEVGEAGEESGVDADEDGVLAGPGGAADEGEGRSSKVLKF